MKQIIILIGIALFTACTSSNQTSHKIESIKKNNEAAQLLINARYENKLITLPTQLEPKNLSEGYAIQNQVIKIIKTPQIGWKVAITNKNLMQKAGVTQPVSGPLFKKWVNNAPQTELHGTPTLYGFEFEFAFKMNTSLPKKDKQYSLEEVKEAVASMHIAIEPVGTRYEAGPVKSGVNLFAADHGGNHSFVHGPAITNWKNIDLPNTEVIAYFDNIEVGRNLGSNVLGNPLKSLTWLTNHLIERGYNLKAGDWVTTGAIIGPIPVQPPVKVKGDFGKLGTIEFDFKN